MAIPSECRDSPSKTGITSKDVRTRIFTVCTIGTRISPRTRRISGSNVRCSGSTSGECTPACVDSPCSVFTSCSACSEFPRALSPSRRKLRQGSSPSIAICGTRRSDRILRSTRQPVTAGSRMEVRRPMIAPITKAVPSPSSSSQVSLRSGVVSSRSPSLDELDSPDPHS